MECSKVCSDVLYTHTASILTVSIVILFNIPNHCNIVK